MIPIHKLHKINIRPYQEPAASFRLIRHEGTGFSSIDVPLKVSICQKSFLYSISYEKWTTYYRLKMCVQNNLINIYISENMQIYLLGRYLFEMKFVGPNGFGNLSSWKHQSFNLQEC